MDWRQLVRGVYQRRCRRTHILSASNSCKLLSTSCPADVALQSVVTAAPCRGKAEAIPSSTSQMLCMSAAACRHFAQSRLRSRTGCGPQGLRPTYWERGAAQCTEQTAPCVVMCRQKVWDQQLHLNASLLSRFLHSGVPLQRIWLCVVLKAQLCHSPFLHALWQDLRGVAAQYDQPGPAHLQAARTV